jgi:serine-type D-Ala-D-Ala carboxypeptidase
MASKELTKHLHKIIELAISLKIASSISLSITTQTKNDKIDVVIHRGVTNRSPKIPTEKNTIYDLASITKIVGTTVAIAKAISDNKMDLDEKPFINWRDISIRSLLAHTSGLPAHRKFYKELGLLTKRFAENRQLVFANLFELTPKPKSIRIYSDLGFMALGYLLEKRYKKPLFYIFSRALNELASDSKIIWFASCAPNYLVNQLLIAPTGTCSFTKRSIRAQVHDPNCYFMGGLEGHAGLFSDLDNLAAIGKGLLLNIKNPKNHMHKILANFADKGLGFTKPDEKGTTKYFSPKAFGHFGYTGTSLWIDPYAADRNGLVIALLTNRVKYSDKPEGIFWLRSAIHQSILKFFA